MSVQPMADFAFYFRHHKAPMPHAGRVDDLRREFWADACPQLLCGGCPVARDWTKTLAGEIAWCAVKPGHVTNLSTAVRFASQAANHGRAP